MAAVAFNQLDKATHDEYACTFAALILSDEGIEITADKIKKVVEASGNKVDSYWPGLFAKALAGKKVSDLISAGAPAGGAPAGGAPAQTAAPAKTEAKKEEPKKEEEADVGLGGGLFGDDDDF